VRYLRAAEVREAFPMSECIEAMVHLRVVRRPDADLAELLAGRAGSDGQPFTLFKSVGIAAQDAAAAIRALDNAERLGIGVRL